ncbi:glycosyl hydrolase [Marinicrinis sediminis]|uniref:Glycosyl hydrolase n=1 Tax=Marinicrinis sediminis TaxID=1652465 RepID=A0ABW5RCI4_9BACL
MRAKKLYGVQFRLILTTLLLVAVLIGLYRWIAEAAPAPISPVNSQATPEAREVLKMLYEIQGNRILAGQHDYLEVPDVYTEDIAEATGTYPILHGYELGAIMGQSSREVHEQRLGVINSAINWHKQGGLVTMTYHAPFPGMAYEWQYVKRPTTQQEFDQMLTPGTSLHVSLLKQLDEVAYYLKKLRDANVPVLWRPYHEMNGEWFWWGEKKRFKALWALMYTRFTEKHKLHNLLWVWSANAPNRWSAPLQPFAVSQDQVDVYGLDIYDRDYQHAYDEQIRNLAGSKPVAITESGEHPLPILGNDGIRNDYVWFMTWGKKLHESNEKADTLRLYRHASVETLDGVTQGSSREVNGNR